MANEVPLLCPSCHTSRTSCSCHRRNNDPLHPALDEAKAFIEETRFFGHEAQETAFVLIQSARCQATQDLLAHRIDGFSKNRIDRDCERLIARAKGKLFGTSQRMSEHRSKGTVSKSDGLSNVDRLKLHLNLYMPKVVAG